MISLPCTPSLPKSPIFLKTGPSVIFNHPPRRPIWKFRSREFAAPWKNFFAAVSSSDFGDSSDQRIRTLFPGGFKRPEIKVPTLVLKLTPEEVLESMDSLNVVDSAVSKWAGIVLLDSGEESGGKLYEAARALKSVIQDRAYFLISERVDIAAAVGSSGVVLSDKGIPSIVARNMMRESKPDSVLLPLVARTVQTENSAIFASSSEGADFIILSVEGETYPEELVKSVSQNVKVPIFAMVGLIGEGPLLTSASNLLQTGANGLVVSLKSMKLLSDDILSKLLSSSHVANKRKLDAFQSSDKLGDVDREFHERKRKVGSTLLEEKTKMFIEAERLVLLEAVAIIRKAAPLMEEISLLIDAVSRLDDPFLLVIVGEFNSGKSTVINALLGKRYLKEGVVPTTNEITLLCYSEMGANQQERCERHPDGQFICYLPAPILKEMNLVDTPGTNVILQRQQRLTEEFVPRADLILFVISADRPLTESEVAFLRYIQQWKKKVVFVLNKSDIYQNKSELEEATAFIKENTQKLLNTESVALYPVSARHALEAKLLVSSVVGKSFEELQLSDPGWMTSGFYELEKFLFSFLDGSTDTGIERIQLKLETPIGIAVRLLSRCESLVRKEFEQANHDLISIEVIISSLKDYTMKMESESSYWRKQTLSLIEAAKVRAVKLVESTLQLSNLDLVAKYFFEGEKSISGSPTSRIENEIINPTLLDVLRLLGEYQDWLQSSNTHEGKRCKESFTEKLPAVVNAEKMLPLESHELLRRGEEHSLKVLENFSASAAAKLFEQEIREVVIGTFGGLGAAGLSASLLTSVLPTTVEDLLALGLCSAGGLFAISKFPARRKEVTDKVSKVADSLARELEEAMQKDLSQTMENLRHAVEIYSRPYQDAAQHRLNYLLSIQEELSNVGSKLRALQTELQNLHVS